MPCSNTGPLPFVQPLCHHLFSRADFGALALGHSNLTRRSLARRASLAPLPSRSKSLPPRRAFRHLLSLHAFLPSLQYSRSLRSRPLQPSRPFAASVACAHVVQRRRIVRISDGFLGLFFPRRTRRTLSPLSPPGLRRGRRRPSTPRFFRPAPPRRRLRSASRFVRACAALARSPALKHQPPTGDFRPALPPLRARVALARSIAGAAVGPVPPRPAPRRPRPRRRPWPPSSPREDHRTAACRRRPRRARGRLRRRGVVSLKR